MKRDIINSLKNRGFKPVKQEGYKRYFMWKPPEDITFEKANTLFFKMAYPDYIFCPKCGKGISKSNCLA